MSALTVNLKQYYQRWILYYFYFILLCMLAPQAMMLVRGKGGEPLVGLLVVLIAGVITASMQRAILSRPVSFCLPHHSRTMQKVILLIGIIAAALSASLFLSPREPFLTPGIDRSVMQSLGASEDILPSPAPTPPAALTRFLPVTGALGAGLAIYALAVWAVFSGKDDRSPMFGLTPILVFALLFFDGHILLSNLINDHWWACLVLGLLGSYLLWRFLGNRELARRDCGRLIAGIVGGMNLQRAEQVQQKRRAEIWTRRNKPEARWFENISLHLMSNCPPLGRTRSLLGAGFELFSRWVTWEFPKWLGLFLLLILFYGYFPMRDEDTRISNFLYILPLFVGFQIRLPVWNTFCLTDGRSERFWRTLLASLTVAVVTTLVVALLTLLANLLSPVLPAIPVKGNTLIFTPMNLRAAYVPFMLIPIGYTACTIARKNALLLVLIFIPILITGIFWIGWLTRQPLLIPATLTAATWLVYILSLKWRCHHRLC